MNKARYIVIEGTEGVGKTTQAKLLADKLSDAGYSVLLTKEPGTHLAPLTMTLRGIMLDKQYDEQLTPIARELISQAIRSIHLEKVIVPALRKYDFIIQDRGILSGLAYGDACGNDITWLENLATSIMPPKLGDHFLELYDNVILLTGDVSKGLNAARTSKQEFKAGDAIEAKGLPFMNKVNRKMREHSGWFDTTQIKVNNKTIEQVSQQIICALDLEGALNGKKDK